MAEHWLGDRSAYLANEQEWTEYKDRLDAEAKHRHVHAGEPIRFPCLVQSRWDLDEEVAGGQLYTHTFIYDEEFR